MYENYSLRSLQPFFHSLRLMNLAVEYVHDVSSYMVVKEMKSYTDTLHQ